jgi:hypothetical protein
MFMGRCLGACLLGSLHSRGRLIICDVLHITSGCEFRAQLESQGLSCCCQMAFCCQFFGCCQIDFRCQLAAGFSCGCWI